ncbi:MAG: hypothetical protein A2020_11625 [Lentisphaerae bacterium GWF2_45_14]|nr:MAG: hypothetical protein A2020_11625 [Lentisphaerae bacterium GWF2_45_14]
MENTDKKTCKMCYMEIPEKAKKCPYCHQWQNKFSMICFHPLFAMLFFIIPYCILAPLFFESIFYEGEPFSEHKEALKIIDAVMNFGELAGCQQKGKYPTVAIIGKIKNTGDIYWKDVVIEAQIFNKDGKLIDTKQQEQYKFVVLANGESAFKLSFATEFPKEEYNHFKIFIRSAKDLRARF